MIEQKIAAWEIEFLRYCRGKTYSESTKKVYWGAIVCFIWHFKTASVERISWQQIADYINRYDSARTMAQKKYAIQLFYSVCIGQKNKCALIPDAIIEHKIPEVLNIEEAFRVMMFAGSWSKDEFIRQKQRLPISMAYFCALRISEVQNLKIKKIDLTANFLFVAQSKGKKDRDVPIPEELKKEIVQYLNLRFPNGYTGEEYLFDGQDNFCGEKKEQYSQTALRIILKRALKLAGIHKEIVFHSLRHSRATHWHNSGVFTLRDIADLLGHVKTTTTEIYLHTQREDLRDKNERAQIIMNLKVANRNRVEKLESLESVKVETPVVNLPTFQLSKPSKPLDKTYTVSFNGKEFIIRESKNQITQVPDNHKWALNKDSAMVMDWFRKKRYTIKSA